MNELIHSIKKLPYEIRSIIAKYFLEDYYLTGYFGEVFYMPSNKHDDLELQSIRIAFKKRGWHHNYIHKSYLEDELVVTNHNGLIDQYAIGTEYFAQFETMHESLTILEEKLEEVYRDQLRRVNMIYSGGVLKKQKSNN